MTDRKNQQEQSHKVTSFEDWGEKIKQVYRITRVNGEVAEFDIYGISGRVFDDIRNSRNAAIPPQPQPPMKSGIPQVNLKVYQDELKEYEIKKFWRTSSLQR